ncbi:MAG TPA: YfhO family protein, partial [Bryobacteraceae bacterium]|nr:YfhO family protein [Bryobacteraceae bacterium]
LACLAATGLQRKVTSPRLQLILLALLAVDVTIVSSGRPFNAAPLASEPGANRTQLGGQTANLATVRRLANQSAPPWRIDTIDESMLWVTSAPATQLHAAGGNDVLALVRVIMSRTSFSKAERWGSYWPVTNGEAPALAVQNVRYLLTRTRLPEQSRLRFTAEIPGGFVYEVPDALPRFFLVSRLRHAGSMDEAARLISAPNFSPSTEAVVEQARSIRLDDSPPGQVRVARYEHGRVELETDAPGRQFLVSSEAFYPGWKAWIDGREAQLLPTNTGFRGLAVPAGRHSVRMEFQPGLFYVSAAVSAVSWLLLALIAWRRRRSSAA